MVLGIGNTLLTDEGAGIHALHGLPESLAEREGVRLVDGGTLSFTLVSEIEGAAHLLVLDAARLDAEAGTVRVYEDDDMDRFLSSGRCASVHEVSLLDLLGIAALTGHAPARRALVGVEPGSTDWGDAPTPPVAAAIQHMGEQAAAVVERWRS